MVESLQGSLPVAISGTSAAANLIAFAFAIPVAAQSTHVTEFNISRCAVDRSQGRLLDLTLPGSHLDALLNYVADRSSQLRCLKLVEYLRNYEGGSTPLTLHITKLQQLEELHLVMKPWVDLEDFETIGIACPMYWNPILDGYPNLKSLDLRRCSGFDEEQGGL
ncbi:hypothetical protein SASPL_133260 [Salvia splendens]|uniref:Uncharacterized protein n=1 Tax=Salvia splendens TaxID=180675 RepID=A0A8X8X2P9_SALSN|nr:hypothetical protein SASPL_133260 [Salvia splendens]